MSDKYHISEQILQRMERLGSIGHWHWDIKHNEIFWSQGVYDIHGINFEDYTPTVDAALDAYITEDRGDVEDFLTRAIEDNEDFKFEKRIKRPDGELRHIIAQGECEFCDQTGELISVFGVFQDVTPIRQQEELYELAALGSSAAIWDWDVKTDQLRWAGRSAEVLGYASNQHLPKTTRDFYDHNLHEEDQEKLLQAIEKHFTKLDNFAVEIRIKRQDEGYEWFLCRAQAQFNDYGKAIRVCGSMTSIRQLKETQAKLETSNMELENFASIAAHEIKSPVRSIGNYLELIKRKENKNTLLETGEYIDQCIKIAHQTNHMIDELLEYASLQEAELCISSVSIEKVTKRIIRSMKQEVKDSNAVITLKGFTDILCDETKIKTVMTNLIQNAVKYRSERQPEISISMLETQDYWQISVKDNGIGIPEGQENIAFDMFQRLDNAQDFQGTGIGLAICARIVTLHGGKIWVEPNQAPENGSTFHFTIYKRLSKHLE